MKINNHKMVKGFTLMEILIVVIIIGLLAFGYVALPEYGTARLGFLVLGMVALFVVVWGVLE